MDREDLKDLALAVVICIAISAIVLSVAGCSTAKALASAPDEYWSATQTIFLAFLDDLLRLIKVFIPF